MKLKDVRGGAKVRVTRMVDESADRKFLRKVGHIRSVVIDDHGASKSDPMLVVAFRGIGTDAFWLEEIELVTA